MMIDRVRHLTVYVHEIEYIPPNGSYVTVGPGVYRVVGNELLKPGPADVQRVAIALRTWDAHDVPFGLDPVALPNVDRS